MARTFTGTSANAAATLTITGSDTDEFYVKNTGSNAIMVNVPAVHGADFDTLAAGDTQPYASSTNITSVLIKSAVSDSHSTYTAGVTRGNR